MQPESLDQSLPAFLQFAKRLLSVYGGSLLLLFLGVCFPLLLFAQLALSIQQHTGNFAWDERLLLSIHANARPWLDQFALFFTKLGVLWGVIPVVSFVSILLVRLQRWRSLLYLLIAIIGSFWINRFAKLFFHRVRPHLWDQLAPEASFSFPSGHAMSSMTLVVTLLVLAWGTRWFAWLLAIGLPYAIGIGWTRLYLGVHFPSDIVAGWMMAIAWVLGVSVLLKPHLTATPQVDETTLTPQEGEAIADETTLALQKNVPDDTRR
jgi:undecaprenyl-diphosphatase